MKNVGKESNQAWNVRQHSIDITNRKDGFTILVPWHSINMKCHSHYKERLSWPVLYIE